MSRQLPSQIEAITESVGDFVRKDAGEKPINVVGLGTDQWVAMDYCDVLRTFSYRNTGHFTTSKTYGKMRNWPTFQT